VIKNKIYCRDVCVKDKENVENLGIVLSGGVLYSVIFFERGRFHSMEFRQSHGQLLNIHNVVNRDDSERRNCEAME
jgi:hypothetical protein